MYLSLSLPPYTPPLPLSTRYGDLWRDERGGIASYLTLHGDLIIPLAVKYPRGHYLKFVLDTRYFSTVAGISSGR